MNFTYIFTCYETQGPHIDNPNKDRCGIGRTASVGGPPWENRLAVFLKAAELIKGPWRDTLNAATMLGQSKSVYEADADAACELMDFFRYNAWFVRNILEEQPGCAPEAMNRMEYRPLEGFVFAVTP